MCDLSIDVFVDDAVDFLYDSMEEKEAEFRAQASDADDYDRMYKKWLSEVLLRLAESCHDFGYYRGGGTEGLGDDNSEVQHGMG
jgi:hypothetical protein